MVDLHQHPIGVCVVVLVNFLAYLSRGYANPCDWKKGVRGEKRLTITVLHNTQRIQSEISNLHALSAKKFVASKKQTQEILAVIARY